MNRKDKYNELIKQRYSFIDIEKLTYDITQTDKPFSHIAKELNITPDILRSIMKVYNIVRDKELIKQVKINNINNCNNKVDRSKIDYNKINEKRKQTCLQKYGKESNLQTKENISKSKATKLERYGDENYNNKLKREQTNLQKYGYKTILQTSEIQCKAIQSHTTESVNKRKQTCLDKYGVDNVSKDLNIVNKIKNTKKIKYGSDNYNNIEKQQNTMVEKYGVRSALQHKEFLQKSKLTLKKNYGVTYTMHNKSLRNKQAKSAKISSLENKVKQMLINNNIEFIHQYTLKVGDIVHTFDFAIIKDHNITMLVDCDGLYYHGYMSDDNGKQVLRDYYDPIRQLLIPENVKFIVIVENNIEQGFQEILNVYNISYEQYIADLFSWCRSIDFPYPHYTDDVLKKSYNSLLNYSNDTYNPKCRLGDKIIKHFHPSIYHYNVLNKCSPYECWYNDELL